MGQNGAGSFKIGGQEFNYVPHPGRKLGRGAPGRIRKGDRPEHTNKVHFFCELSSVADERGPGSAGPASPTPWLPFILLLRNYTHR